MRPWSLLTAERLAGSLPRDRPQFSGGDNEEVDASGNRERRLQQRRLIPLPNFLRSTVGRVAVAAVSFAVLMPIITASGKYNQVELVQPISLSLQALAIALGIGLGLILAEAWMAAWRQGHGFLLARLSLGAGVNRTGHNVRFDESAARRLGRWPLMLVLAIGAVLTATKLARETITLCAFTGVTATAVPERFTIVDKIHDGRRTRAHLEVRLATGGRTFNVRVSTKVFASARQGDTLLLPVETGRGGIQRMVPPEDLMERADSLLSKRSLPTSELR